MSSPMDRRNFFKVVGVGSAAGVAACTPRVEEKIIPHVVPPEDQIPGEALWFSSTCTGCNEGCGITVRNREGRALKVEGNPDHPISQGGLCVAGHSMLQATYHPDRYRQPLSGGKPAEWDGALAAAAKGLKPGQAAVLTGDLPDSSLRDVFDGLARGLGGERVVWEPIQDAPLAKAAELVFGRPVVPLFRFEQAGYILSLGADFLETWQNPVYAQKGFAKAHGYHHDRPGKMAKLVQVDPRLSLTAANSDEWLQPTPGSELDLALALLAELLKAGKAKGLTADEKAQVKAWIGKSGASAAAESTGIAAETIQRLAKELAKHGPALVVAGGAANQYTNATQLQIATLLLNKALGSVGKTVALGRGARPTAATAPTAAFAELLKQINDGTVKALVVHGTNPVFTAPAAWKVAATFAKLDNLVVIADMPDETGAAATQLLPHHGAVEAWGDHLDHTGVASLAQPAMKPLWGTRHAGDIALELMRQAGLEVPHASFEAAMEARWRQIFSDSGLGTDFATFWEQAKIRGGWWPEESALDAAAEAAEPPVPAMGDLSQAKPAAAEIAGSGELHLIVYPHVHRYDGRFANRGWCQEIPDPLVQSTWSNWVEIHPTTAKRMGIGQGDRVKIATGAGAIEVYAYTTTGVLPEVIAVPLGQGHGDEIGRYGSGIEGNPFALLDDRRDALSGAFVFGGMKANVAKVAAADKERITGIDVNLVTVDGNKTDLGRGIAQVVGLNEITKIDTGEKEPHHAEHHGTVVKDPNGFYPPHEHPQHRWGMVIDTHSCTGCGGCVAACYSENNIPVVGKTNVAKGREMAWIRIERYYETPNADNDARFVPMLCQQCNNAPCEPVCPVIATYHTVDGLNGMVYNRCVGTRYCGNNCSYKVRRFNYWGYDDPKQDEHAWPDPMHLMLNPDVSVRSKGVMEKCTFCVQRIRYAQEHARLEDRAVQDGEFTTACAQSCPADAITFGDLKDPNSKVAQLADKSHRGYKVLEVLNTQPAVTYLKKVHWTGDKA